MAVTATLNAAGFVVHSLAEPGISSADSATLSTIATFLVAAEQRRASKAGSKIITAVRQAERPVGRPSKPLPVSVDKPGYNQLLADNKHVRLPNPPFTAPPHARGKFGTGDRFS